MGASGFNYYEPKSVEQAVSLLSKHRGEAKVIAGGTDLLVRIRNGDTPPRHLISLRRISRLQGIRHESNRKLTIGACTTIRTIEKSPLIQSTFKPLAEASSRLGSIQIRNLATLGGNLCNAAPSADCAPPLLVLDARVSIAGPEGRREEMLKDLFTGPGSTGLKQDEILTEVHVPLPEGTGAGTYLKLSRRREMDLAVVGVAAMVIVNGGDGMCTKARIALGAVAPTPFRAIQAEMSLTGKRPDKPLLEEVAHLAAEATQPITDVRASAEYRKLMARVFVQRGLLRCFTQMGMAL
jgi:carbon-monoxide dehydrogenase medium subunit